MSSGCTRRGPKIVALVLLCGLLAACTGGSEPASEAEPTTAPTSAPTETPVAEPSPTVVTPTPTPIPSLADDDPASVTTVEAGVAIEDPSGNLIAVHSLGLVPPEVAALAALDLFGDAEDLVDAPVGLLDVSWCSSSDDRPIVRSWTLLDDPDGPLGRPELVGVRHPLRTPEFVEPDAGGCVRGWATLELMIDPAADPVARYVHRDAQASDGERHVYQWLLPRAEELGADQLADAAPGFARGQTVTFNEGSLVGTTVVFGGWAELFDADSPVPDTRVVGVLVEVCPATEDWPELGLAIDGWNVLEPFDPADRLGADPLAPLSGNCFEDWAEFAVPLGFAPSDFFVSDGVDPVLGFASWTLEGAAIAPPG